MRKVSEFVKRQWKVEIRRKTETNEYVVRFFYNGTLQPELDYFTNDKKDAEETAKYELTIIYDHSKEYIK